MLSRPAPLITTAIVVIGVAIVVTTSGSTHYLILCNTGWMRDRLCDRLRDTQPPPQAVVLDLQMSSDLDIRGLDMLWKITDDLSDQGIELRLANVHGQTHEMLHRGASATTIGIQPDLNDVVRPGAEIGQERG